MIMKQQGKGKSESVGLAPTLLIIEFLSLSEIVTHRIIFASTPQPPSLLPP